jgi:hypothetical protein
VADLRLAPIRPRPPGPPPPPTGARLSRAAVGLALTLLATLLATAEAVPRLLEVPAELAHQRVTVAGLHQLDDAAGYVMRPRYAGRLSSLEFG